MQSISIFLDISKFANFQRKNADVGKTQGVCHMVHGSKLKVYVVFLPSILEQSRKRPS